MAQVPTGQGIETVERAADVLNAFIAADGASLGVTELAGKVSLSKAVVHRILTSLRSKGYISLDEETRRYSLGPSALSLGLTYLRSIDVRELARPFLKRLSDRSGETATLSIKQGLSRMYVEQVTPDREVKMTVQLGRSYPLHAGSSSKAFLSHLPDDEVERVLSGELAPLTDQTIVDPSKLRKDIQAVKERGYAVSLGERQEGAGSLAAPVFDHDSVPVAVISVCGPIERFRSEIEELAPLLLETTTGLSTQLGWREVSE